MSPLLFSLVPSPLILIFGFCSSPLFGLSVVKPPCLAMQRQAKWVTGWKAEEWTPEWNWNMHCVVLPWMHQDHRSHDDVSPLWPEVGLVWACKNRQEEARPAASQNLLYSSQHLAVSWPLTITESAHHLAAFQEVLLIISTSIKAEKSDITFFMLSVWRSMQSLSLNYYCFLS